MRSNGRDTVVSAADVLVGLALLLVAGVSAAEARWTTAALATVVALVWWAAAWWRVGRLRGTRPVRRARTAG
ncbi:hypothetical protein AB1207_19575 [Kineococcus endophyticus]|uniref:Uncharacterized protein n=1 Tax=Kineococcus endophyticus TaxID=1181883 RepID=A0ABV3PBG3_9ACTN